MVSVELGIRVPAQPLPTPTLLSYFPGPLEGRHVMVWTAGSTQSTQGLACPMVSGKCTPALSLHCRGGGAPPCAPLESLGLGPHIFTCPLGPSKKPSWVTILPWESPKCVHTCVNVCMSCQHARVPVYMCVYTCIYTHVRVCGGGTAIKIWVYSSSKEKDTQVPCTPVPAAG